MKVLISGASGLIGREVSALFRTLQAEVSALARAPGKGRQGDVLWQPGSPLSPDRIADFDVVVHLGARSIATVWSEKNKSEILQSRVEGTSTIAKAVASAFHNYQKPKTLICSSAIGYYGSRGDEKLTEESGSGLGFLAEVCREWEQAANPAAMAGVRVVHVRTALVLDSKGGALAKMLPAFRLGVAGKLGDGHQWWSWVSLRDTARAYVFAAENERVHGALNLAAPEAVTNEEFTRTLGRVLHRPTLFSLPSIALRVLPGGMADEVFLASQRVLPKRLLEAGFGFGDVNLELTLRRLLS